MTATARRSLYADRINTLAATLGFVGTDPRHIEAYMRLGHSTLDGLSVREFAAEVRLGCECVAAVGPVEAEACAQSFGL
jgi:hypothetical protein